MNFLTSEREQELQAFLKEEGGGKLTVGASEAAKFSHCSKNQGLSESGSDRLPRTQLLLRVLIHVRPPNYFKANKT